jgi:hypothetical protein
MSNPHPERQQCGEKAQPVRIVAVCDHCGGPIAFVDIRRAWRTIVGTVALLAVFAGLLLILGFASSELQSLYFVRTFGDRFDEVSLPADLRIALVRVGKLSEQEWKAMTPDQQAVVESFARARNSSWVSALEDQTKREAAGHPSSRSAGSWDAVLMSPVLGVLAGVLLAAIGVGLQPVGTTVRSAVCVGCGRRATYRSAKPVNDVLREDEILARRRARKDRIRTAQAVEYEQMEQRELGTFASAELLEAEEGIRRGCQDHSIASQYFDDPEGTLSQLARSSSREWRGQVDTRLRTIVRFYRIAAAERDQDFIIYLGGYLLSYYHASKKTFERRADGDTLHSELMVEVADLGLALLHIAANDQDDRFKELLARWSTPTQLKRGGWNYSVALERARVGREILLRRLNEMEGRGA